MLENINKINVYRSCQKLKVILFLIVLVVPFTYFLLFIDWFLIKLIFSTDPEESLRHLFDYSVWRITIFTFLQYVVFTILGSILYHLVKLISRNKDFFLA
jgi:ABC-type Fe3+ transport system permease subunit